MPLTNVKVEVWYCWKELAQADPGEQPRLLTPRSNSKKHEEPFDFIWETPEQAKQGLDVWDVSIEESANWILVKATYEAVELSNLPADSCPGCTASGDSPTEGCKHPMGCGWYDNHPE